MSESSPSSGAGWKRFAQTRFAPYLAPFLLPIAIFYPRVLHGGLTGDDWFNHATWGHLSTSEVLHTFWAAPISHRAIHPVYVNFYDGLLGTHAHWYLAYALAWAVLFGCLVTKLLLRLGVPTWVASAVGALGVVAPYTSITKLWFTAHIGYVTGTVAVLGILIGLRGLRARRRWVRIALHACAMALFLASIDWYELALPIVLASGICYLVAAQRADRAAVESVPFVRRFRPAIIRWILDLLVVAGWYLKVGSNTDIPEGQGLSMTARLGHIFTDGLHTITGSFVPFLANAKRPDGTPSFSAAWFNGTIVTVVIEALVVFALFCLLLPTLRGRLGATAPAPVIGRVRWWGAGMIVGAIATYAGWIAIVPAADWYRPLPYDSTALRVNVFASFGMAAIVVCTIGAIADLLRAVGPPRLVRLAPAVPVVLLICVAGAYARHDRSEVTLWNAASSEQLLVLKGVATAFDHQPPPHGSVLFLTDTRPTINDDAEVFLTSWSFRGAMQSTYDDMTLEASPHRPNATYECLPNGFAAFYLQFRTGSPDPVAYGKPILVSATTGRKWVLTDQRTCEKAVQEAGLTVADPATAPAIGTT